METYKERRNYSKGTNTRSKGFLFKMSTDEKKALVWLSEITGKTQSAILSECLAATYLAEREKYIESTKGA